MVKISSGDGRYVEGRITEWLDKCGEEAMAILENGQKVEVFWSYDGDGFYSVYGGTAILPQVSIHQLQWGQRVVYRQARGWGHPGVQPAEHGPYEGEIVGFEEDALGPLLQVRQDGWFGDEPIYVFRLWDIISLKNAS